MADFLTREKRSALMATIKSRGNKRTELVLAKLLRFEGISGWRRHQVIIERGRKDARQRRARPDFIFRRHRVALFVDGCFWHACPLHGTRPKTRKLFWLAKLKRNAQRDASADTALAQLGWKSVRVWEHEIKQNVEDAALRLWVVVRSREAGRGVAGNAVDTPD